MKPEIIHTMYERDWNVCKVVRHPDPQFSDEWLAVYNSETGEYLMNSMESVFDDETCSYVSVPATTDVVKRYWHKFASSAGYDAADQSAWIREVGRPTSSRRFGKYTG